jgi:uroporphyrinogen-III synthase
MRVLVTRPLAQALATAELLRRHGHEPLVDPILAIEPVPLPPLAAEGYRALLVTSVNAVPSLPDGLRSLPVFAVGSATATALRAAGWPIAGEAAGDGRSLADLVAARLPPGRLLHPGGEDRAPALARDLAAAGFVIEQHTSYRAVAASTLPDATCRALENGALDAVLLLSPRSALVWCGLVHAAGLADGTRRLVAACISEAVAEAAGRLVWRAVRIAPSRDQTALIGSLDDPQVKVIAETRPAFERR